jgi:hypothetical protein
MRRFAASKGWIVIGAIWLGLLGACGPRPGGYPYSELDTSEQHVFNGFAFLKKERVADAQREFSQALTLDPKCSSAYRGLGLVYGRKKDFTLAFDSIERARAYAKNSNDQAMCEVAMMSLYRMERGEGWLVRVETSFGRAVSYNKKLPEAYFELGVAYEQAYRFQEAEKAFDEVLKINTLLVDEAREERNLLKKIELADPTSTLGKELVLRKSITRSETAALLNKETHLIQGLLPKEHPGLGTGKKEIEATVPSDVADHPKKEDILTVLRLEIQGFGTLYDGSFGADQPMTRAAFAMVMADVLTRTAGKPELYHRYSGVDSPFLDVRENSSYFSSVMICSEWAGIMGGWSGYFHPMETISGVDALLIIREAEKKLKGLKS